MRNLIYSALFSQLASLVFLFIDRSYAGVMAFGVASASLAMLNLRHDQLEREREGYRQELAALNEKVSGLMAAQGFRN